MAMALAQKSLHMRALYRCTKRMASHARSLRTANGLPIEISERVVQALKNNEPVVALESTIITHGMPYPANLDTAVKVEDTIRANGAVPATIGIIKGRVHVGLDRDQLEQLASLKEPCVKTSRRDLPYVLSKQLNGGTTVSGTMLIAAKARIPIFVTGGIGGVHRGAGESFDVSADLTELGRTPVAVVSSGVKSILDIGKTLEYLETQGVCVATLGTSDEFPAFFTASSGFRAPYHVKSTDEAAQLIRASLAFGAGSGLLIAVPIPESSQADGEIIEQAIRHALALADERRVRGKDVTPFVLSQVNRITAGASLAANMALIEHNASVGARIAADLARLSSASAGPASSSNNSRDSQRGTLGSSAATSGETMDNCPTVVVGGSVVDLVAAINEDSITMDASTHRGKIQRSFGGVGRNLADALTRLGRRPLFVSVVGQDEAGRDLLAHNAAMVSRGVLQLSSAPTAFYAAILDKNGDCKFGIGDFKIHEELTVDKVRQFEEDIARSRLLVMDANIGLPTMQYILDVCRSARVPVWYEPTDLRKATKPFLATGTWDGITYTSPNLAELKKMISTVTSDGPGLIESINLEQPVEEISEPIAKACWPLLDHMHCIMVTLGKHGMLIVRRGGMEDILPLAPWIKSTNERITSTYYPAIAVENVISVSGAGDCLVAGFITGILNRWPMNKCAALGMQAAASSLKQSPAVPEELSKLLK